MDKEKKEEVILKKNMKPSRKSASAKKRMKPRGLWGLFKGRIHYNKDEDVFNLEL